MLNAGLAFAIALAVQSAAPQQPTPDPNWPDSKPFTRLFQNLGHDLRGVPTVESAQIIGIGGLGALAAHKVDDNLGTWAEQHEIPGYAKIGGVLGDGWFQAGAAVATYAVGKLAHHAEATHVGGDLIRSQILTGVFTVTLKQTAQRTRPNGGNLSFPSGHSAASFASAAVIQQHYGWGYGLAAYATAGFIGWTRIESRSHWLSDVVFGSAVGIMTGHTVASGHHPHGWKLVPVAGGGKMAIYVVRK